MVLWCPDIYDLIKYKMLKVTDLQVSVEGKNILNGVDVEVGSGKIVAFMGPNGSGKSSLAFTLAGHPKYIVQSGKIEFLGKNINEESVDERARLGMMLSMQYPMAIPGLPVHTFLWRIYKIRIKESKEVAMNLGDFRIWLSDQARNLNLNPELLRRSLNDGFSGGEKKKLEVLQILCFRPKMLILDEIDSGLDVDALKIIGKALAKYGKESGAGIMVITHYLRILEYLRPDTVHILKDGKIQASGGYELAMKIEKNGY